LLNDESSSTAEWFDVGLVVDDLVETLRLRGHEISWTSTSARAWGCHDDVAEVVHVLLENAVRHGRGDHVEVTLAPRGESVEVRVHDGGPGIAPEVRRDLFRRGVRRTGSPGEGIGLSIARHLADEMGAVLRLEPSDPEVLGSTFVLSLPATPRSVSWSGEPADGGN
jgi:signal transduction histidine kinase